MRYRNIIIGLGFLVILIQFLGFPQSWKNALYALSGALVVAGGYLSEKERKSHSAQPSDASSANAAPQP